MNDKTITIHKLAEQLLLALKLGNPFQGYVEALESISDKQLNDELGNDDLKKAFWVNVYNAYFLILRKHQNIGKPKIYSSRLFTIAGHPFSLDDVEHGILRKYRYKLSLGYLQNPFVKNLIKQLAVDTLDYRIHFALNCGAESCPPIAFYTPANIESQLEMATLSFLEGETDVADDEKKIKVTKLFQWYLADFGGMNGIKSVLQEKLNIDTKGYKIEFKTYSWTEDLDNFI